VPHAGTAIEAQIVNFGNTPSQLLERAHAPRGAAHAKPAASLIVAPGQSRLYFNKLLGDSAVLAVAARAERIVTVAADRRASCHGWRPHAPNEAGKELPFHLDTGRAPRLLFGVPFADDQRQATTRFAASGDGRLLYSCGYWDHSLKVTQLADGRSLQSVRAHTDVVSCLALSDDGSTLVTGSRDTTLMVWPLVGHHGGAPSSSAIAGRMGVGGGGAAAAAGLLPDKPRHVLHGHDDEVTCVVVSAALDTVVSGSADGTAIVHALRTGQYVRTVEQPSLHGVDLLALSSTGTLVLFSRTDTSLHTCTFNQRHRQPPLASAAAAERLAAVVFSQSGEVVLTAGEAGAVVLRRAIDLRVLHRLTAGGVGSGPPAPLHCLSLTADEQFVLAGSQSGHLLIWGVPAQAIARSLLDNLDRTLGLSF